MTQAKLHIAHVLFRFDTGGLENGVVNLINRLGEKGYQHSIITLKGHCPEFAARITTANVQFFDLAKQDGNDWRMFLRLNKLLKTLKPNILHTRNLTSLECQFIGWWRGIKGRVHGEHGWDVNDLGGCNPKFQKLRRLFRPFIHHYIALSTEARDYLQQKIKVAQHKITHICNGVDTDKFSAQQSLPDGLPEHFKQQDNLIFGTVGRLADVKNQPFLLEAFIQLQQAHPDQAQRLKLLIVGEGVLRQKLESRIAQANIQQHVFLAGNQQNVAQWMDAMDVFVLPSLAEGISNTILEAMASGLPVIATKVGGNPDLIMPELAKSHLVPTDNVQKLTNAMAQYALDNDKLAENSVKVQKHCQKNFSIDTMVASYHQLYQQLGR
ncbi:TIGR03088 family PEP-CTERM/XrtA system glycosyltransferase [uncultured Paraglaciecola sp.]|uniref:TIGR03088 family PEP-CTERM/XrtA system glycosyltransferase n=1 Tax=uncultured Paraglaciecola sp. TaxID=1765024 RepID=UPI00262D6B85|nr:TIGR03088 family PEP-CTERM/XrtA system glycosyltransferase [uncultured Paraglaciecola sp.]